MIGNGMHKLLAEFIGTLILVLLGCGAAVISGEYVGQLGIALAFGLAVIAGAYSLGPISGGHFNPAISLAAFLVQRISARDLLGYCAAQVMGGIGGALILAVIVGNPAEGFGQNGWGPGFLGEYSVGSALLFETTMTTLFVIVVLGATRPEASAPVAGVAIGLTLAAIHIVGIDITGVSVNPARSIGPALLAGDTALRQLWLFIVAPLAGAMLGAWLHIQIVAASSIGRTPKPKKSATA